MKMLGKILFGAICQLALPAAAQDVRQVQTMPDSVAGVQVSVPADSIAAQSAGYYPTTPLFAYSSPLFSELSFMGGGPGGLAWPLHEGFNAAFSASVTAGLGKHSPRGAGWGQTAAFAYMMPLGKKFSFAGGVYADHFTWGPFGFTDVGLAAQLGYRVNDRIALYAYFNKSLLPRDASSLRSDCLMPGLPWRGRDLIGVAADFKISEKAAVQISVSVERGDDRPLPPAQHRP